MSRFRVTITAPKNDAGQAETHSRIIEADTLEEADQMAHELAQRYPQDWTTSVDEISEPSPAPRPTVSEGVDYETVYTVFKVAVVLIVVGGLFFLAPVVPYQQCTIIGCGSATVSPSYALFGCGLVWNTVTPFGNLPGGRWVC